MNQGLARARAPARRKKKKGKMKVDKKSAYKISFLKRNLVQPSADFDGKKWFFCVAEFRVFWQKTSRARPVRYALGTHQGREKKI